MGHQHGGVYQGYLEVAIIGRQNLLRLYKLLQFSVPVNLFGPMPFPRVILLTVRSDQYQKAANVPYIMLEV